MPFSNGFLDRPETWFPASGVFEPSRYSLKTSKKMWSGMLRSLNFRPLWWTLATSTFAKKEPRAGTWHYWIRNDAQTYNLMSDSSRNLRSSAPWRFASGSLRSKSGTPSVVVATAHSCRNFRFRDATIALHFVSTMIYISFLSPN